MPSDVPPSTEISAEAAPDPPADPVAIERRYFAAADDPDTRIAVIHELAGSPPAVALTLLNRLFSVEHREDVKSAMLAELTDLDHTQEKDNQLALCMKALATGQPKRVRYLAIHTLVDLHDLRAHAILVGLQNDPDRELRSAATQALSDLPK